ncbi:hypothetical protein C8J57DRAFT_1254299 [Mycena rebaudengoi]|nr:hypothetical protein C8J57DRAFT_1254299 [Mycena rebaudengoi]
MLGPLLFLCFQNSTGCLETCLETRAGQGPWLVLARWLATARHFSSRRLAQPRHLAPTTSWLYGSPRGPVTWGLNAVLYPMCLQNRGGGDLLCLRGPIRAKGPNPARFQ